MEKKRCSRCGKNRRISQFRERVEKRRGYNCKYLNNTCKKCDKELAAEYYQRVKDDTEFKKKNITRVRKYSEENREKIRERECRRKKTKKWKAYMKKWIANHKDRVLAQGKIRGRRWAAVQRKNITEQYILMLLTHPREDFTRSEIRKYPELIEFYQSHIKFKRLCKRLQTSKT